MKRFLICTVSSLALGLAPAMSLAQDAPKGGGEAPAAGGAEQVKPPEGKAAPTTKMAPGAAGGAMKPSPAPGQAGEPAKPAPKAAAQPEPKPGTQPEPKAAAQPEPKAGAQPEPKAAQKAQQPEPQPKPPAPKGSNEKAGGAKPAAGAPARPAPKLSQEQRSHVQEGIRSVNARPVHVDFNISIGIAVPRTVELQPVPSEIVTYVPEYEGYDFFLVAGEIVIVDPESLQVVAVLPL